MNLVWSLQLRLKGPQSPKILGTLRQKWRQKTKYIFLIIYHTAISPRDFLTRADQDYSMFPGLNGGGNLSPEAWTWGSRCSAWTKWRGHLNSLSRKGSLRFTHWSLVSILFGEKKKWNDDSSLQIQSGAGGDCWLMFWGQISDSQTWLHSRIPWGTSKKYRCLGTTPDLLIQNLQGWGPKICILWNFDQVVLN